MQCSILLHHAAIFCPSTGCHAACAHRLHRALLLCGHVIVIAVQGGPLRLPSGLPQGDLLLPPGEQGDEEGAGSSSEDTSDAFYQALHREFETQEQIKFGLQNAGACTELVAKTCFGRLRPRSRSSLGCRMLVRALLCCAGRQHSSLCDGSVRPGADHVPGSDRWCALCWAGCTSCLMCAWGQASGLEPLLGGQA